MQKPLSFYVDVDDTLIRSYGSRRIPIQRVVDQVRALHAEGAVLYCWSSGGAEYSKRTAEDLGIANCFVAFLPKPNVLIDDVSPADWPFFYREHPNNCGHRGLAEYEALLGERD